MQHRQTQVAAPDGRAAGLAGQQPQVQQAAAAPVFHCFLVGTASLPRVHLPRYYVAGWSRVQSLAGHQLLLLLLLQQLLRRLQGPAQLDLQQRWLPQLRGAALLHQQPASAAYQTAAAAPGAAHRGSQAALVAHATSSCSSGCVAAAPCTGLPAPLQPQQHHQQQRLQRQQWILWIHRRHHWHQPLCGCCPRVAVAAAVAGRSQEMSALMWMQSGTPPGAGAGGDSQEGTAGHSPLQTPCCSGLDRQLLELAMA